MIWLLLTACIENGFTTQVQNSVAATYGDFDDITPSLDRLQVNHSIYEGLISNATWTDDDVSGIPIENLFFENEMRHYDVLMVMSGTRGLGVTEYNSNRPDNELIADEETLALSRRYVRSHKSFVLTDWAYDLGEQAWPDAVEYYGDDAIVDSAQVGDVGAVIARVTDDRLAESLGMDQLVIDYNFSNWAVITDVGPDTTVWLRGDVRAWNGDSYEELSDVPLLVSYEPEGPQGHVVVMTFHANAQPFAVTDTLLETLVGPLPKVK